MIRKAIVLAAGQGTRLGGQNPKALYPLLGIPILIRTLHNLRAVGIQHIYIVVGFKGDLVRREIERYEIFKNTVHCIENPLWEKGNGVSVLAAEPYVTEPFILTMCDHIYPAKILQNLMQDADLNLACNLMVDFNLERIRDRDEATRVLVKDDKIVQIGKRISFYNAIDTGIFLALPQLFDALHKAVTQGADTLSDGVQILAESGNAGTCSIGEYPWQDVDTPQDIHWAERILLQDLGKPTDGPISRTFNRKISTRISGALSKTRLHPNHLTLLTLLVGLLGAWIAASGGYGHFLTGAILFKLASILDGCDGEIARLKYIQSRSGQWLDTLSDNLTYLGSLVGITLGLMRDGTERVYLTSGIAAIAFAFLSFILLYIYLYRMRKDGTLLAVDYAFKRDNDPISKVLRRLSLFGRRDVFATIILGFALLGILRFVTVYMAMLTLGLFVFALHVNIQAPHAAPLRVIPTVSIEPSKPVTLNNKGS